jgi:2-polyprenyl-3-methyl-5-hydroxy-6-metoxy-1,4-benzoquinol methylase
MNKLIYDRKESIANCCKGKVVLDLGCTQHRMMGKEAKEKDWLHFKIKQAAQKVIGLDILKDEVERLNKVGYSIMCGNVENIDKIHFPINQFDVIVCGELIEHLSNPGLFLKNVKKIMDYKTLLIITTPNVYSRQRIKLMLNKKYEREWLNKEHKCWYSFETLKQLLISYDYKEVSWGYYSSSSIIKIGNIFWKIKQIIKGKINYKHYNQIELEDGLFVISKVKNGI